MILAFYRKLKKKKHPLTKMAKKLNSGPLPECTICMTVFKHDTTFPQHMKAHEAKIDINAAMVCPVCTIEVESRKALNPHIKEHHPEKNGQGCCIECLEFMPVSKKFRQNDFESKMTFFS